MTLADVSDNSLDLRLESDQKGTQRHQHLI